jgi:hypothetical protein
MMQAYNPLLSGEALTVGASVSASLLALAAVVASNVRRHGVRLRGTVVNGARPAKTAVKSYAGAGAATPLLSGIYRGRTVEMTMTEAGLLCVTARMVNPSGVFAEFSKGDFPLLPWLHGASAYRLKAMPERWSIAVRGRHLLFSCQLNEEEPEKMRRALDLTCDLAEAIDHKP